MNYQRIYDSLMERAPKIKPEDYYTEGHHIKPRCMGGEDWDGIAYLKPEEHFLAHQLLVKIYPNHPGLVAAVNMMCRSPNGNNRRVNNKMFGWLRRRFAQSQRGHNLGIPKSEEAKRRMSEAKATPENLAKRALRAQKKIEINKRKAINLQKKIDKKLLKEEIKETIIQLKLCGNYIHPSTGRKMSEEARLNNSIANKGRKKSPEHVAKIKEAKRLKQLDPNYISPYKGIKKPRKKKAIETQ